MLLGFVFNQILTIRAHGPWGMCALHLVKIGGKNNNFETAVCLVSVFVQESLNSGASLSIVGHTVTLSHPLQLLRHTHGMRVYMCLCICDMCIYRS